MPEQDPQSLARQHAELLARHDELVRQMGDEIAPFPAGGIDGFLSHFIMCVEFLQGDAAGTIVSITMPPSLQTVARSDPFRYPGRDKGYEAQVPIPAACTLSDKISDGDFLERPEGFFTPGAESVWMQILNLDARMETDELGTLRILLGETLKAEYGEVFQPSLGVAESLGRDGFPARLFFNPCAVVETAVGAFRAIHGTLAYGRVTRFPPTGTPISITDMVPLESVDEVVQRKAFREAIPDVKPFARLIALSHPIDVAMQISGEDAFKLVERRIATAY